VFDGLGIDSPGSVVAVWEGRFLVDEPGVEPAGKHAKENADTARLDDPWNEQCAAERRQAFVLEHLKGHVLMAELCREQVDPPAEPLSFGRGESVSTNKRSPKDCRNKTVHSLSF